MAFVFVKDNNIEVAIRKLKQMVTREGIFRDFKQHCFFEKPSEKRVRERKTAMVRRAKAARKKRERDRETGTGQNSHYRRPEANKDL